MYPPFLYPGTTQFDTSVSAHKIPSIRLLTPWQPLSWIRTANAIREENYDALICIWWTPFTGLGYGMVCRKIRNVPILFLLHNVLPHEKMPLMMKLSHFAFRKADGFIIQSKKVEEELLKVFPPAQDLWRRICLHPLYESTEFPFPTKDVAREHLRVTESKILLFFGIVRRYKGLHTLLTAFPEILRYFKEDIRLIIAGEFYEDPREYFDIITKSDCSDKISLHNHFIPIEELGIYFQSSDVVVLPYLTASQSGVIQLAYGQHKPVIASAVGGIPEVVEEGKTGLLFPPGDSSVLARKVIEFYENFSAEDWAKNIEEAKSKFSWDIMAKAVADFVDKIKDKSSKFKVQSSNYLQYHNSSI
jgi:glycosyltransferase involved in cell wall biosynthesis